MIILAALLSALPARVLAWPVESQWIPVYKGGAVLTDPNGDSNGSRNIVSDPTHPAAYYYSDGVDIYYRLRLDDDPSGSGGQGLFRSFGWGVEIDTNRTDADYEWLFMVDGIADEWIILHQNAVQGTLGDPSDSVEVQAYSLPPAGNYQIAPADTSFNGNRDYFLVWRFPWTTYSQALGLDRYTPIRLFFGSSSSTQSLVENGADLVGASDLYTGWSDYITSFGGVPSNGSVRFAADIAGNGDVTVFGSGEALYIRVDDGDENYDNGVPQTVAVTVTTSGGDSETVTLTETGADTGVFTGALSTAASWTPAPGDGTLQAFPGDNATVTFVDGVDAALNRNVPRTDAAVASPPAVSVAKTAAPASVIRRGEVTYTIVVSNAGNGVAVLTSVADTLPAGFGYVPGSTTGFTTADPSVAGSTLTWSGTWIVPRQTGGVPGTLTLSFRAAADSPPGTFTNSAAVAGNNFPPASTGNTAPVTVTGPNVLLSKSVDRATAPPGAELTYAVAYRNMGDAAAQNLIIIDMIHLDTAYVPGSLRMGGAGSTYAAASPRTDADDGDGATWSGAGAVFTVPVVPPDDGVPGSGSDEGVVFFKVRIR